MSASVFQSRIRALFLTMPWVILSPPLGCGKETHSRRVTSLRSHSWWVAEAGFMSGPFSTLLWVYLLLTSSSFSKEPPWLLCNFLSWYLRDISTLILVSYAIYVLLPCHVISQGLISQKLCLSGYDLEGNVPEPPPTRHWSQFMKDRLFIRGAEGNLLWRCKGKMTGLECLIWDLAFRTCWLSRCPCSPL